MIANLLTALRARRSSRHYVGRHRLPEEPVPVDDTIPYRTEDGVEMVMNDGTQTMVLPPVPAAPLNRRG